MSSSENREIAVPKYFIATPNKPEEGGSVFDIIMIVLVIAGSMSILIGFTNFQHNGWMLCLGIPGTLFAGSLLIAQSQGDDTRRSNYAEEYKRAEPKPSDQQMDEWRNNDLERIRKESLSKLDLLPNQVMGNPDDPIMVIGPSTGSLAAMGNDNIIRFSRHDVVIVYLTDYHLAAYSCTIDLSSGLQTRESTQEYHYTDVVSVATQTDNSRIFKVVVNGEDKPLANYQKFALSVASGERIEVAISFPQIDNIIKNARLAPTGAENAVKIIRARLREKKGGTQE